MFCRPTALCLLNCIPESTQVTEGSQAIYVLANPGV